MFSKQLHQRLLCVKSAAESTEIVEKLKTLEQEISALKSALSPRQKHGVGAAGIHTNCARTALMCRVACMFYSTVILQLQSHLVKSSADRDQRVRNL